MPTNSLRNNPVIKRLQSLQINRYRHGLGGMQPLNTINYRDREEFYPDSPIPKYSKDPMPGTALPGQTRTVLDDLLDLLRIKKKAPLRKHRLNRKGYQDRYKGLI